MGKKAPNTANSGQFRTVKGARGGTGAGLARQGSGPAYQRGKQPRRRGATQGEAERTQGAEAQEDDGQRVRTGDWDSVSASTTERGTANVDGNDEVPDLDEDPERGEPVQSDIEEMGNERESGRAGTGERAHGRGR